MALRSILAVILLGSVTLSVNGQQRTSTDAVRAKFTVKSTILFLGPQMTPDHYDLFDSLHSDPHNSYFDVSISHGKPKKENMGTATVQFVFEFESYAEYVAWRRSDRTHRLIDMLHHRSTMLNSNFVARKEE